MKNALLFVSFLFTAFSFAQDCYLNDFTQGTQWTIHTFNKKGDLSAISTQKIDKITQDGDSVKYSVYGTTTDEKGKKEITIGFVMSCIGNVMHMNLESLIPAKTTEALNGVDFTMTGDGLSFPHDMTVGQKLPEASIDIEAGSGDIVLFNFESIISNRTVESKETIQVGAGTFEAFKIVSDQKTNMKMIYREYKETVWYVPGIGVVKSETYDSKGNLESSTEMVAYTKG